MEMKWTASHMNVRSQGHSRAVSPWTSDMFIYINIVSNISATSLVQVAGGIYRANGPLVKLTGRKLQHNHLQGSH